MRSAGASGGPAWGTSLHAEGMFSTAEDRLEGMLDAVLAFLMTLRRVATVTPDVVVRWPDSSAVLSAQARVARGLRVLRGGMKYLSPLHGRFCLSFPDKRLIQFDCGKLQELDRLLRRLKVDKHRCLIFTQV